MRERPILFSAPMVRAILEGRKTQTRRIVKLDGCTIDSRTDGSRYVSYCTRPKGVTSFERPCPYGAPGDRLWVRETTRMRYLPNFLTGEPTNAECGEYEADGAPILNVDEFDLAWWYSRKACPAIHMPRWASRITLVITGVRVERLHDISESDARAEGVDEIKMGVPTARDAFRCLWSDINGDDSWTANPWLWVVSFRRVESNLPPARAGE